ncbi:MAG: hypothetical protein JST14_16730 [Bacteroidetes bacterium]|nr:hypothetical protein [Bacteroidota bacterium]
MKKSFLILLFAAACSPNKENASHLALHWEALADRIVKQGQISETDRVIMLSVPGDFDPLIDVLATKIKDTGATYVGTVSVDSLNWPESWKTDTIRAIMNKPDFKAHMLLDKVTLGIMLPGATPQHTLYAMLQDALRQGAGRTIHFHWTGAFDTSSNPIPLTPAMNGVYEKAVLETDYESLAAVQSDFERDLQKGEVTITTPEGTDLKFRIDDRPVTRQDGDASFDRTLQARNLIDREVEIPAGAVRVAPIESTVNGVITFPDGKWGATEVKGLKVTVKDGLATEIVANEGLDSVKEIMSRHYNNRFFFREIAVGFNPLLKVPQDESWIPYYGYGSGVLRISVGDNEELGGEVRGDFVRICFITNATITAGGTIWVTNGELGQAAGER